jgi:hypothetical protein
MKPSAPVMKIFLLLSKFGLHFILNSNAQMIEAFLGSSTICRNYPGTILRSYRAGGADRIYMIYMIVFLGGLGHREPARHWLRLRARRAGIKSGLAWHKVIYQKRLRANQIFLSDHQVRMTPEE